MWNSATDPQLLQCDRFCERCDAYAGNWARPLCGLFGVAFSL
ncbi:hypothetical protein [Nostoc favosum]|nr:hypothetical protein [Nostoc favosum]